MKTDLQQMSDEVLQTKAPEERIKALTEAFELFSHETARLETAYKALKEQFKAVNIALEETNRQLNTKVIQLDMTTNYLNNILENIVQGILFVDINGNVTTYNTAAEKLMSIRSDKVLFSKFWDNFTDDLFGFSMLQVLNTKAAPATTFASWLSEGALSKHAEISTTFVHKGNKSDQGLIVLIRDITEIRRLQIVASRNDRMKELGEMAASVAHEIRNPLGGIKGFASLLIRDLKDQPQQQKMAAYIVDGSETIDRLVTKVLNYSRPMQLQYESVELVAYIQSLIQWVKADSNIDKRIQISLAASASQLIAPIDSQLLRSALLNLVVNAAQAMPNGGSIALSVDRRGDEAFIQVSDTGVGIPPENLEKIFSPFFTTKAEGNGFGLAEVHKIIQTHGGVIDVQSSVDHGTTFTIKLPLKA